MVQVYNDEILNCSLHVKSGWLAFIQDFFDLWVKEG